MTIRLPDFVVLGQGKAGTSLIYKVLAENPQIGLSEPKELHYFNVNLEKGQDWYASHFAHIPQEVARVGEISPSYLRPDAISALSKTLGPKTKVIFVLRRPIERAYSRYLQDICAKKTGPPFKRIGATLLKWQDQLIEGIQACYDVFGADRVLPLFYEMDIDTEKPAFERKILSFLGLPTAHHFAKVRKSGVVNAGVMPRYLYTADKPLHVRGGPSIYRIPPNHLVFCGQRRNSEIIPDPSPEQIINAFTCQSRWSASVPMEEYRMLQRNTVLPTAERLEKMFGFDMSHWRIAPYQIMYMIFFTLRNWYFR